MRLQFLIASNYSTWVTLFHLWGRFKFCIPYRLLNCLFYGFSGRIHGRETWTARFKRFEAHGTSPVILPFAYEAVSATYYQPTGPLLGQCSSFFRSLSLRAMSRFNVVS